MPFPVYSTDLGNYLARKGKFKYLLFKSGTMMIDIEIENQSKLADDNLYLVQKVQEKCWPVVQMAADALIVKLKPLDTQIKPETNKKVKDVIEAFNKDIAKELIALAMKTFGDFAKDRKDYTVYLVKSGVKIGVKVAMLGVSIGTTAAGGFTGVGTVVGIIGMVRSAASITQQIIKLSQESKGVYTRILTNVVSLKRQLSSTSVTANTAKQVGATVLNKAFAVEIETIVVTVAGLEADFDLLLSKIKGNKVNSAKLAVVIQKMLDEQDKLDPEIKKLEAIVKSSTNVIANKDSKKVAGKLSDMKKDMTKLEANLNTLLTKCVSINENVDVIEKWIPTYHKDIKDLSSKYNKTAVKVAGVATDLVIAATSFVAGDFVTPADTIKNLYDSAEQLTTGLTLANDGLSTLVDSSTSIAEAV